MIRIITPVYNAKKYIGYCLASINMQTYKDWKCYICDDMSTDGTVELIKELIKDNDKFELIENTEKIYPSGNYFKTLQRKDIHDEDICISVDGDDRLNDDKVFENIIKEYDDNTWITYGSFITWDGINYQQGFAQPPQLGCDKIRESRFTTTHLRTFKVWLFRKIKEEDFKYENKFIRFCGDLAFMFPMLEMAGDKHSKYLEKIYYIYNTETDQNEFKVDINKARECDNLLRCKPKYKKI